MKPGTLQWSRERARRFLVRYHFTPGPLEEVLGRLGSVQYDPLRPVGRNHDLVLQARVPGYRVDDWEGAAYERRIVYDAWDKQACLVPPSDWRYRSLYHEWFRPGWESRVLVPYADTVQATLAELASRGPLSSLDFEDQSTASHFAGSWYGPKLVKQVLRALWDTGQVVTHHREAGRHVYALPENVIPEEHLCAPPAGRQEALRFLILRRHQSAGLLRSSADAALWSMPSKSDGWRSLIGDLVAEGELTRVEVEGDLYHVRTSDLEWEAASGPGDEMLFIAPLDPLVWDRKSVARLFGFEYVWEVYKPESKRRWGYYVLPVLHGDSLVARMEARLEAGTLRLERWWWEPEVLVEGERLEAFVRAAGRLAAYAGATEVRLGRRIGTRTRRGLAAALRAEGS